MSRTRGAWPIPGDLRLPFEDEDLPVGGHEDYLGSGGTLDRDAYLEVAAALTLRIQHVLAGRAEADAELANLASEARVSHAPCTEPARTLPGPGHPMPETWLARLTTDLCPSASTEAADRFLGPLADVLSATGEHQRTRRNVLAAMAFSVIDGADDPARSGAHPGFTPFRRWCKRTPLPSVEDRHRARTVLLQPVSVYSVEVHPDGGWMLVDRLQLADHVQHRGPVDLSRTASPYRPPQPGDTLVGRVVTPPEGPAIACNALVLPVAPPPQKLRGWLRLLLWKARLRDRRLTHEALLRRHAHALYRHLCEWTWQYRDVHPYRDAHLYDLEYNDHTEDIEHYVSLAKTLGGRVLELGCGTGRLAIALARAGVQVDGIDLAPAMLEGLNRRLSDETPDVRGRIRTWLGDFTQLQSDQRYRLVIWPFNALHHCRQPHQVVAVLNRVRSLLEPGGRLAVDCYLPDTALFDRNPDERAEERDFTHPVTGEVLASWEQGWWDPQLDVHHVMYSYQSGSGHTDHTHLQLRMYELDILEGLFAASGWRPLHATQDYRGTPVGPDALKWVGLLAPEPGGEEPFE